MKRNGAILGILGIVFLPLLGCQSHNAPDEAMCRIPGEGTATKVPAISERSGATELLGAQSAYLANYDACMKSKAWDFRNLNDGIDDVSKAIISRCQVHADNWHFAELMLMNHQMSTADEAPDNITKHTNQAIGYVAKVRACLKSGKSPAAY